MALAPLPPFVPHSLVVTGNDFISGDAEPKLNGERVTGNITNVQRIDSDIEPRKRHTKKERSHLKYTHGSWFIACAGIIYFNWLHFALELR